MKKPLYPFYKQELDRSVADLADESSSDVLKLLSEPDLIERVSRGEITLAMIRPNVGPEANTKGLSDLECAQFIEEMIKDLGVLAKFSFRFTKEVVEEFYEGSPRERMENGPPKNQKYNSRWPEFIDFMTSGPTTVLLLHSPKGDAIDKWREQIGHWNIDEVKDPSTIRGVLGVDVFNNLIHGSDSSGAVIREINLISKAIKSQDENSGPNNNTISLRNEGLLPIDVTEAEWLMGAGILSYPAQEYMIEAKNAWQRVGLETYVLEFTVETDGKHFHLIAKACIKFSPTEAMNEWMNRRALVESVGISTPKLHALAKATLVEEFIPYTFGEAYKAADPKCRERLENEFIRTVLALYRAGFNPKSLHDIRSHGEDVVLVDFGEDLGGIFSGFADSSKILEKAQKALSEILRNI